MHIYSRLLVASALAPLLLLGSGCQSDDVGSSSAQLEATLSEFAFTPDTWTAPANEDVTVSLTNIGAVTHEYVILQHGVTISSEADLPDTEEELLADFVLTEEEVEPGETGELDFNVPAGTYQIICAIRTHFDAGMEGTLTVE
ncbi:MAG: cupredoxin domain-containing protein [Nitriliruptoraceae bacterium]